MALLDIVKFPDPRLKQRSKPVTSFDETLKTLVVDMSHTMYAAPGVGLAAVQVGELQRLFIMDSREDEIETEDGPAGYGLEVFINPEILEASGTIYYEEGCLSLPDFSEDVKRNERILVRYQDVNGDTHEQDIQGFRAVIFQHEFDHLNGILATDRISRLKRSLYSRRRTRQIQASNA